MGFCVGSDISLATLFTAGFWARVSALVDPDLGLLEGVLPTVAGLGGTASTAVGVLGETTTTVEEVRETASTAVGILGTAATAVGLVGAEVVGSPSLPLLEVEADRLKS